MISYRAHRWAAGGYEWVAQADHGRREIADEPWYEPFAPLDAARSASKLALPEPYIELQLAAGSKSDGALDHAAVALAQRLRALIGAGSAELHYGHVAVLCRRSRTFAAYEDAFEAAGIPYTTVAGRGFLDRPEVRDLLNALRALADPTDDLALYGLLRSPAIGLADTELHRLRLGGATGAGSLWTNLCDDDSHRQP